MAPHVIIFPFMSKGHIIPLLHLARHLLVLRRGITVTVITTPMNSPFIHQHLFDTDAVVIEIPFPQNIPQIPTGIENTDKLPSMSLFIPFANATKLMQPDFEHFLQTQTNVACIISDGFLGWTQKSAKKFGIPRYVSYGTSNFALTIYHILTRHRPHKFVESNDESFSIPGFPWTKLMKNDLEPTFTEPKPKGPLYEFVVEQGMADMKSNGYLYNSFYELESKFVDCCNRECNPEAYFVGPLCLYESPKAQHRQKSMWMNWLDERLVDTRPVLYVAFGSQTQISGDQLEEISIGLESSQVSFLWVIRSIGSESLLRLRERVKVRGLIVSEWVDQVEILNHESVNGFMSHCGWNSVMESISASVPILAWPMTGDQYLNARLVVEELGIGVRVLTSNGSVRGFVGKECLENMVKELMEGPKGKEVRRKVMDIGDLARKAMKEGGSSWNTLCMLIDNNCT